MSDVALWTGILKETIYQFPTVSARVHVHVYVELTDACDLVFLFLIQDPNCNFLQHIDADQRQAFRRMVIDMVSLATQVVDYLRYRFLPRI